MKLTIKNFAKIKEAEILVDGITVIAGENNTGKSTVGKLVFSLFNSLSNIEQKIFEERLKEIAGTNWTILRNYITSTDTPRSLLTRMTAQITNDMSRELKQCLEETSEISEKQIAGITKNAIKNLEAMLPDTQQYDWDSMIEEISGNISEILNLPENVIVLEIISRYFGKVFHTQINSVSDKENQEAAVTLEIKGKKETLLFRENTCRSFQDEMNIVHKAIYIDNPFIIDELSGTGEWNPMSTMLKELLVTKFSDGVVDGVIETVRAKEKLSDVYEMLQNVVDGEVILKSNDEFYLKDSKLQEAISFQNLSTGMKSFVILKMLIEKGCLKEKDVVILDEPEIHLHPQWQIAYAELIVLLQKHFDLSVIVTTHSPYFVDALQLFSCKYGTGQKVNYYLSSNVGNAVTMDCVTGNIDLIYKKMASPIQMLDTLRYELNHQ